MPGTDGPRPARTTDNAEQVRDALEWITRVLDRHAVPYQVVGGLAAIAHGATRPLNDIDLYAPLTGNDGLLEEVRHHVVWGPASYRDEAWDLVFMKLAFGGLRIEIGDTSAHPRYFDRRSGRWIDQAIHFARSERRLVFGVEVNVMALEDLVRYKSALGRHVDLQDVAQLTSS